MCLSLAVAVITHTPDAAQFPEGHAPASLSQGPLPILTLVRAPGEGRALWGVAEPVSRVKEVPLSAWGRQLQQ